MATCSSCGAAIFWATTGNGKLIPIDAEPNDRGNITIHDGVAKVHGRGQQPLFAELRYMSHFATCPHAGQHRRNK